MCPPRPMPAAPEVSAYDALLSLVDRKQLSITFVLGLARGGHTRTHPQPHFTRGNPVPVPVHTSVSCSRETCPSRLPVHREPYK